jgi:hypothetical protein
VEQGAREFIGEFTKIPCGNSGKIRKESFVGRKIGKLSLFCSTN